MKISIRLSNQLITAVEVNEEDAYRIFRACSDVLLESSSFNKISATECRKKIENAVEKFETTLEKEKVLNKPFLEIKQEMPKLTVEEAIKHPFISSEPIVKTSKPFKKIDPTERVIFYKCSECEKVSFAKTIPGSTVKCFACNAENTLNDADEAFTRCPNCGKYSDVLVKDVYELTCRNCESPIDLHWHEKHQRFESQNMKVK